MPRDPRRACHGKYPHEDRDAALNALYSLVRNRGADLRAMSVYRCPYCRSWHVGHRLGAADRRRRRRG